MAAGRLHLVPSSLVLTSTGGIEGHFRPGWTVPQVQAALRQLRLQYWAKEIRARRVRLHADDG